MADKSSHGLGAISSLPILSATAMAKIGCLTCAASHHQWFESPVTHFRNTRRASTVRVFGKAASQGAGSVLQQTSTLQAIQKSGVIACLRAHSAGLALETACIALDAGISVLEITMATPEALKVIEELVQKYPSAVIGAGTVLTYKDAKNAELAGAKFLMSPAIVKEILEFSKDGPILYIPGAMTPTEVLNAYAFGAKIVKIYPIALLGGGQYMRALKTPFKHIPLVASHGITMDSIESYIGMGASAVVLSDAIFNKTAMSIKDWDVISQLASSAALKGATAAERSIWDRCAMTFTFHGKG